MQKREAAMGPDEAVAEKTMTYEISTARSRAYLIVRVMEPMTAKLAGRIGADATRRGREENINAFLVKQACHGGIIGGKHSYLAALLLSGQNIL